MAKKERRYKVSGRLIVDYELVVQALDADEARYFASDIDLDKWQEINADWQILEVNRDIPLKLVRDRAIPDTVSEKE